MRYFTLENFAGSLSGKTVFVRVDTNTTLIEGKFQVNERIKKAARIIRHITREGARVIVGTHNGRQSDLSFVSLGPLGDMLNAESHADVRYIGNTYDPMRDGLNEDAVKYIKSLPKGRALLLENLRFLEGETEVLSPQEHAQSPFIRSLIDDCKVDYFVNDAFSTSHRAHRSIVGFTEIPNIAGLTMDSELSSIDIVMEHLSNSLDDRLNVYILGGVKIQDYMGLVENSLHDGKVQKILAGGLFANLCLFSLGYDLGEENKRRLMRNGSKGKSPWDYLGKIKELIGQYREIFELPSDVAVDQNGRMEYKVEDLASGIGNTCPILDIGDKTTERYLEILKQARMVFIKGPLGRFEDPKFNLGSRKIINTIAHDPKVAREVYSVMGGGDTAVMLAEFRIPADQIDYISLAGGALLEYLAGKNLPGVTTLEDSYKRFGSAILQKQEGGVLT